MYAQIPMLFYSLFEQLHKTKEYLHVCICNNYAECYAHFFNFYRFNTALLLLNYSGNFDERRNYYNQISSLKNGVCDKGGVSLIFQLSTGPARTQSITCFISLTRWW